MSRPYYSKEHIDKNLKEILEYLQDEGSLESKHRANIITQIFEDNIKAKKVNNYLESKVNKEDLISSEEATALLVDYNWTQRDYQGLKNLTDKKNRHFLPPYKEVLNEKKKCLPDVSELFFDDTEARATVKGTLDHDQKRLLKLPWIADSVRNLKQKYGARLKLKFYYKTGFDGSTQKQYKVRNYLHIYKVQLKYHFTVAQAFVSSKNGTD